MHRSKMTVPTPQASFFSEQEAEWQLQGRCRHLQALARAGQAAVQQPVQAARAQQRRVQQVRPRGRAQHDDT